MHLNKSDSLEMLSSVTMFDPQFTTTMVLMDTKSLIPKMYIVSLNSFKTITAVWLSL